MAEYLTAAAALVASGTAISLAYVLGGAVLRKTRLPEILRRKRASRAGGKKGGRG